MRIRSCVLLALLLGGGHSLLADALYSVTDLGNVGGSYGISGSALNNAAQVIGTAFQYKGPYSRAFLYSDAQITDLGTLGGSGSEGNGINDAGQMTGASLTATGDRHAFLYSNGRMADLGTLGGGYSVGSGINDAAQVTGYSGTFTGMTHAFLYSNGQMMDLGSLGGNSIGTAINEAGQVTGESNGHAFLYSNGEMRNVDTLGSGGSIGYAINNAGQVTGAFITSTFGSHAFLYSDGEMVDLGTLGGNNGIGTAINDAGQITGQSNGRAFLYSHGQMVDLNDLIDPVRGMTLTSAAGINDNGQIVANGSLDFAPHAFLLTPVPEPSTLALLGVTSLVLLAWQRLLGHHSDT